MRRCVGLVALAFVVAACSVGSDVVDGRAQEDIDNEPPYGAGVVVGETYDYVMYVHCDADAVRVRVTATIPPARLSGCASARPAGMVPVLHGGRLA